ncbi:MAG: hypothetical protein D6731_10900 [Planctomycetota bacterium]|nr:MAG: hypothetical protein D6731_10900 [Planctomycetota bacterium]
MNPHGDELLAAARALDGSLRRTRRFRRVGRRCFERIDRIPPGLAELGRQLDALGFRCPGTYRLPRFEAQIRAGLSPDARVLGLVVAPADRPIYAEFTTFFADGSSWTTNARPDPAPPRPAQARLDRCPGLPPAALLARHRRNLANLEEEGAQTATLRGSGGPLAAISRYLDALGY